MARLSLSFLGTFQVVLAERPITRFRSVNVQGLLVYLALHSDRAIGREVLATLLWPEEPDGVAKKNLRQSLYQLRKVLAAGEDEERPFLIVTREGVQFNPDCDHALDVAEFLGAVKAGELAGAGKYYAGELLPGFTCPSLEFEDWLRLERERLHRRALDSLTRLTDGLIEERAFDKAAGMAQRQLMFEPWREIAHRQLMLALAYAGDRTAALAQYARCQEVLFEELGIEPETETADMAAQIEANELKAVDEPKSILDVILPPPFQSPPPPPHFVDRQPLLVELAKQLTNQPQTAVALVGMGGLGKSSLAAAVAHQVRHHFTDGVLWADVRNSSPHNILASWAAAFGHDYSGLTDLASRETAVRSLLANKKVLLILDDIDNAAAARPMTLAGEQGAVLMTSRNQEAMAALNADVFQLAELSPTGSRTLLSEVLGQERVMGTETAAADEIGHLLAHLPLAMEIVAQLLKSRRRMTLTSMAARLHERKQRMGLAVSDLAVRTSFQISWETLDDELRDVFAGMALFNGRAFAPAALAAVTDRDQFDVEDALYTLSAFSLVRETGQTRYQQHPLLADFAAEKLTDWDGARVRYGAYYLDFARAYPSEPEILKPEWENLSAAIRVAGEMESWQLMVDFMDALSEAWLNYGYYNDALEAYRLVETAAKALDSERDLARVLLNRAKIENERSEYDTAWEHLEVAQRIFYQIEDGPGLSQTHLYQGSILADQGEYGPAERILKTASSINLELSDVTRQVKIFSYLGWLYYETDADMGRASEMALSAYSLQEGVGRTLEMVEVLRLRANIELRDNNLEAAFQYATEAADLSVEIEAPAELGASNIILATVFVLQGEYDRAISLSQESLELFQRLGNKRHEGILLRILSSSFLRTANYSKAKSAVERALSLYQEVEDRLGYGYALRLLGDIHDELGQIEERDRVWKEAHQLAAFLSHANLLSQLEERMT